MATYPVGLPVGTVTLSIYELVGDRGATGDADDLPDALDVTVTVEFLPTVKMLKFGTAAYRLRAYSWTGQSVLTATDGVGSYTLPSTDTPAHDGSTVWKWQARVSVASGTDTVQLTSGPFSVASGATVDLLPLLPLEVQSYDVTALVLPGAGLPAQTGNSGKYLTTDGASPSWSTVTAGVASVAGRTGAVTLAGADISDSTTVGRSVLSAASSAAARTAIGAGTSDLALGVTGTTALAGNTAYVPPTRTVAGKPLSGNVTLVAADISDSTASGQSVMAAPALPALDVWQGSGGAWPSRPTWPGRINWIGYPALTTTPAGMSAGDTYMQRV